MLIALLLSLVASDPKVVLIIGDDLSPDLVGCYGGVDPAATPNIDELAANGLRFTRAWSMPQCSPTRACIVSGRYPSKTGIGKAVAYTSDPVGLRFGDVYHHGVSSAIVGKWHLGSSTYGGAHHALGCGFNAHVGTVTNIGFAYDPAGSYFDWLAVANGAEARVQGYLTEWTADLAIAAIASGSYRLLWVAFHAPHRPLHTPPGNPHSPTPRGKVKAMIAAMDAQIGRILAEVDLANHYAIFVGDNGTQGAASLSPTKAKGTVYEGGVNVPLIIAGPGVRVGTTDALTDPTDLCPTIAGLLGHEVPQDRDGVDLWPVLSSAIAPSPRKYAFTERFAPTHGIPGQPSLWHRAIRDDQHKLIDRDGTEELYDLNADPGETLNLLSVTPLPSEISDVRNRLRAEMDNQ